MRDAVIVSTARTGIGRAFKGSLNATKSPSMTAHAISHAVARAGVDAAEVDDVVIGCVLSAGTAGMNLARNRGWQPGRQPRLRARPWTANARPDSWPLPRRLSR
jgi:acetyl-CoA acetyltransferase